MTPEGVYYGRPTECSVIELGAKKTPFFSVIFHATHRLGNNDWKPLPEPVVADVRKCVNDNSFMYAVPMLEFLGFNGDFDNPDLGAKIKESGASLVCEHTEYQGRTREEWSLKDVSGGASPVTSDMARKLNAKWAAASNTGRLTPATPQSTPAVSPAPVAADSPGTALPGAVPSQSGIDETPF